MAGGVRFGPEFLAKQTAKRKDWIKRGVKAGHGGAFSLDFTDPYAKELQQKRIKGKKGGHRGASTSHLVTDDYFASIALAFTFDFTSLPDWLVDIIKSDPQIKRGLVDKYVPESPHKEALIAVAKDITLLMGKPAQDGKKAKRANPEHYIQVRIFYHLERDHPEVYYFTKAVPNGGIRHKSTAFALNAEGVKSGSPDIDIEVPKGRYHGMKLEVKTESGTASAEQKERVARLSEIGYYAVICKGFEECWQHILAYLALPDFDNMTTISSIQTSE